MKSFAFATVAAVSLAVAGVAVAQESTAPAPQPTAASTTLPPTACPAKPAPIALPVPDGATAKPEAMQAYNDAYLKWQEAAVPAINCNKAEVTKLQEQVEVRRTSFNADNANAVATQKAWTVETEKYAARVAAQNQGGKKKR
jgi:hypothetical protein